MQNHILGKSKAYDQQKEIKLRKYEEQEPENVKDYTMQKREGTKTPFERQQEIIVTFNN